MTGSVRVVLKTQSNVLVAVSRAVAMRAASLPASRRSTEQDLRDVVRLLVREARLRLIGVGLGPDTAHVRDFSPHARASVPLDRFAATLAELLRAVLE